MGAKLIALSGKAGSGKSVIANILEDEGHYIIVKFADTLKSMVAVLLMNNGCSDAECCRYLEGDLKEAPCPYLSGMTPRYAMQTLGTEWGRNLIGNRLWVDTWKREVRRMLDDGYSVVADDCRFTNEAEAVLELGGEVIQIVRPEGAKDVGDHPSEAGIKGHKCRVIKNTGSLEDLKSIAKSLLA